MKDILQSFGMDFHAVIGNHDYLSDTDRSAWDALFPGNTSWEKPSSRRTAAAP